MYYILHSREGRSPRAEGPLQHRAGVWAPVGRAKRGPYPNGARSPGGGDVSNSNKKSDSEGDSTPWLESHSQKLT